jgi:hypothetical protein
MFLPWSATTSRTSAVRRRKIPSVFPFNVYVDVSEKTKRRGNGKSLKKKKI